MVNKVINITKNDPMYNDIIESFNVATDDALVVVARNFINRKDDNIKPIMIKNGIYFYVAYDLDDKIAYLGSVTPEQIYKAKANMVRRARIGTMMDVLFSGGETLEKFEPINEEPMNVVTLDCKMYGGGLLLCEEFLREMKNKIGKYYILPSSIHELIFVPAAMAASKSGLTEMVCDINNTQVTENEILANVAFEMDEWI